MATSHTNNDDMSSAFAKKLTVSTRPTLASNKASAKDDALVLAEIMYEIFTRELVDNSTTVEAKVKND